MSGDVGHLRVQGRQECTWRMCRCAQQGTALIVALLMLTAVMMLGISAVQIALQEEKASRNGRDRLIAFQAAEAALDDAVQDIEHSQRKHLFTGDYPDDLPDGCAGAESDLYRGLCRNRAAEDRHVWRMAEFSSDERNLSVPYGHFTERRFSSGVGMLPARSPRYVIELMEGQADASNDRQATPERFFRITAIGFGARESTSVVVQSFYRKNGDDNNASMPGTLFGWREIANWGELKNVRTDE